jgi:acyl carrier protein
MTIFIRLYKQVAESGGGTKKYLAMNNDTKERVLTVLRKVTGKKVDDITLEGDIKSQLALDSIQIVELFAALEKELDVELPLRLMTVKTGRAFIELLEEELSK